MFGDTISTVEDVQYYVGILSVLLRMFSTVWGYYQYCGGCSVLCGDTISTVEDIQYRVGIQLVLWMPFELFTQVKDTGTKNLIKYNWC